jgi:hypothetical protein
MLKAVFSRSGEFMSVLKRVTFGLIAALFSSVALAQNEICGELQRHGGYGPYDYTDPVHFREKLPIVEDFHFSPTVESLASGMNNLKSAGPDLSYTLMAFPNHHRALYAMIRLSWKENRPKPSGSQYSIDCWLDRAVRWRPEDGVIRMIVGNYLSNAKVKRYKDAIPHYEIAEKRLKNSPNLLYNMGLLYFNLKDYEKSREYAKRAYAGGFALPGLRDMLVRAGKWQG